MMARKYYAKPYDHVYIDWYVHLELKTHDSFQYLQSSERLILFVLARSKTERNVLVFSISEGI